MTQGKLAAMIRRVRSCPWPDARGVELSETDRALVAFIQSDLAAIEWLCRLIHCDVLTELESNPDAPLWGDGAEHPGMVTAAAISKFLQSLEGN